MAKDLSYGRVLDLDMETLQDYSGNAVSVTATGTTLTTDDDGRLNKARDFNGSSDKLYGTLDVTGYSGLTVCALFKLDTLATVVLVNFGDAVNGTTGKDAIELTITSTGTIYIQALSPSYTARKLAQTATSTITTGVWYYVTGTVTPTTASIYLNGILKATNTVSAGTFAFNQLTNTALTIGARADNTQYVNGIIVKTPVWNRALSATEVYQDYADVKHNYQGLFDGLVAGYDFRGDAKDFSGNGYNGTVAGATLTTDQFGMANSAYSFDGIDDYIDCGNKFDYTQRTYSIWFKPGTTLSVLASSRNTTQGVDLWADTSGVFGRVVTSTGVISFATGSAFISGWNHIVFTYNEGVEMKYYLNGVLRETKSITGTMTDQYNLFLARRPSSADWTEGDYDFINVWSRILTADEVMALYYLTKSGYIYPYPQNRESGITQ